MKDRNLNSQGTWNESMNQEWKQLCPYFGRMFKIIIRRLRK